MVTLAFAPVTQPAKADEWEDLAVVGMSAGAGAAIGTAIGDGLGAVVGAGIGAVIGALAVLMDGDKGESYLLGATETYAQSLKNVTQNYWNLAHANAVNTASLMTTSNYYFARKAEWGAKALYDYQTANGLSHVYDAHYVLSRSEVFNATAAYQFAVSAQYAEVLNSFMDLSQSFVGTYAGMTWGFFTVNGGSQYVVAESDADEKPYRYTECTNHIDLANYAVVPATANLTAANLGGSPVSSNAITIKYANGSTAHVVNDAIATNGYIRFQLADFGLPSGTYSFSSSGANVQLFGLGAPAMSSSAEVQPAMISYYKDGENAIIDWAYFGTSESQTMTWCPSVALNYVHATSYQGYIGFSTTQWTSGSLQSNPDKRVDISTQYFADMRAVTSKVDDALTAANAFGQTYYNILVSTGGEGNPPVPDIIFPDPSQLTNLTWQQIYAIYLAYLNQLNPWFYNYSHMSMTNVTISTTDVVMRGSIYNATGVLVRANTTVFTPFVSLDNATINLGERYNFTQPGFFIVWGSAASLDGFKPSNMTYLAFTEGWGVLVEEIMVGNQSVETVTLSVTTISFIVGEIDGDIVPPQGITDWTWLLNHWYLFAGILGIILLLGAVALRNGIVAMIGLVMLAAAILGYYLSGGLSGFDFLAGLL